MAPGQFQAALQHFRRRDVADIGAPQAFADIAEDENEPEGQQYLVEVAALVQRTDEHPFHQHRRRHRRDPAHAQREPEVAGELRQRVGRERADHEERAVRDVDDVHQAEDQRQAGGHHEQQHAQDQAVEQLCNDEIHSAFVVDANAGAPPAAGRRHGSVQPARRGGSIASGMVWITLLVSRPSTSATSRMYTRYGSGFAFPRWKRKGRAARPA